jgi:hypothetical protein
VLRCLYGHIEDEMCYVIVEVATWPGVAVHFGTSGASSE